MGQVIDFKKKKIAIFSEAQKQRLATSVEDLTDKPHVTVDRIEQDLCLQLTEGVREVSSALAEKLGEKIAKFLFKE